MGEKTAKRNREYGRGSVYFRQSDQRWVGKYKIGTKSNGKPDVKVVYGKSEAECHRKLNAIIDESKKTDYVEVQNDSVENYMQSWLVNIKKNELKPKSYDRLEQTLELYVYPNIGDKQLLGLNSGDIQKLINKLRDQNYSYSTIKKAYDAINSCFKLGVIQKTVALNPAVGVTIPSKKLFRRSKIHFYTQEEANKLIEASQKKYKNGSRVYQLGSFVPLLINTGLRMGELLALRWQEDIDLSNSTLTVHNNIVYVKNRDEVDKPGHKIVEQESVKSTAGQDRTIPLNADAKNALLDLQKETGGKTYVMSTGNGTIVSPRNLDRIFRRIAKTAGMPEEKIYGVHALRHTFATLLLSNNVEIKTVSELLGHSDISITYNTYIHVIKEQKKKALDTIPNILGDNS